MLPNYNLKGLQEGIKENPEITLSDLLKKINNRIEYLVDKDHLIGHSYFLDVKDIKDLKLKFFNEIIPLLEEYFY
jgi:5-methylcytosine-specific restriction enzyme B